MHKPHSMNCRKHERQKVQAAGCSNLMYDAAEEPRHCGERAKATIGSLREGTVKARPPLHHRLAGVSHVGPCGVGCCFASVRLDGVEAVFLRDCLPTNLASSFFLSLFFRPIVALKNPVEDAFGLAVSD